MINEEDVVMNINETLEEFDECDYSSLEILNYYANKVEGAIGLAYTIGAITATECKEMCMELDHIVFRKWHNFLKNE